MKKILFSLSLLLIFIFGFQPVTAQPSAGELAAQLEQKSQDWLSELSTIRITQDLGIGHASTDVYHKVNEDGRYVLRPEEDDDDFGLTVAASFDNRMFDAISGASSVTTDTFKDQPVYRVLIDDTELLESLDDSNFEAGELDARIKSMTLFIGRDDLLMHGMQMDMISQEGTEMKGHFTMSDYRMHKGFPVPWKMTMRIEGLQEMFSEGEMQEARRGLEEMERQLESMPQAQREMIERQMGSQIEQLRAIVETGEMSDMEIKVTDVQVE